MHHIFLVIFSQLFGNMFVCVEMFFLIRHNFAFDFEISNPCPKNHKFTCSFGFNINKSAYRYWILEGNLRNELVKENPACFERTFWPRKSQLPSRVSRIFHITLHLSSASSWKMTLCRKSSNSPFPLFLFYIEFSLQYYCKWWRMDVTWRSTTYI